MGEVRDPRLHAVDERSRAIDLAESATTRRQIGHRGDAGVPSEAKGQISSRPGWNKASARFEDDPALRVLAGEPASVPDGAMRDARLGQIRLASTSLRKAAACARIDGKSPRT